MTFLPEGEIYSAGIADRGESGGEEEKKLSRFPSLEKEVGIHKEDRR